MSQRSDQRTREEFVDDLTPTVEEDEESASASRRERVRRRVGRIFSLRVFAYALALLGVGMVVGNAVVPLPMVDSLAGLVGVFGGAFLLGLAVDHSAILESAAAGAVAAGLTAVLGHVALTAFGGAGVPLAAFGAGTGLLAGALGAYLGGDLRDGLTADL